MESVAVHRELEAQQPDQKNGAANAPFVSEENQN